MSKKALAYPAKEMYSIPPEDIVIVGLDTNDGPEHHLWDRRALYPFKERGVLHIMARGQLALTTPVAVCKDGEVLQAIDGRQTIKDAREANRRLVAQGQPPVVVLATYEKRNADDLASLVVSRNEYVTPDDILVKAEKAAHLLDRNIPVAEVAISFNREPQTIRNYAKIHTLANQLKEALKNGYCTQAQAVALADKSQAEQHAAGLAFIAAAEDRAPRKPRDEKEPEAPARVRRKRRGEKTIRKALVGASPAKAATLAFILDPEAKVSALLEHDPAEVIQAFAWVYGEEENEPFPAEEPS